MSDSAADRLAFAVDAAWRAGRIALAHYRTGVRAEAKADDSPVTIADREAERLLRGLIAERYPRDGILGEEFGEERAGADRRWLLDPIDGTHSFVRGVPLFGVLIGLEEEGRAILGVVHFPALDETVYAARGLGCFQDGRPARVSDVSDIAEAAVLTTDARPPGRDGWPALARAAGLVRTWGDCYGHALVATGRAEAMLDPQMRPWDAAAVAVIVEEAGGVVTDWAGYPDWSRGSLVATNRALAQEVRRRLGAEP